MNKSLSNKIANQKILGWILQLLFDLLFFIVRKVSKLSPSTSGKICIISIHKLGDSIFTFEAINSIKRYYNTDVFIICHYNAKDIYALVHPEKLIFPIQKESFHFNDRYLSSTARKLLSELNPEIIIDLTGVMTSASLIFNSNAKKIIGMNRKIFRSIYDHFVEVNTNLISKDIYNNAIKELIPIIPFETLNKEINLEVSNILIAPFAGWKSKEWGLGKFIRLAEKLKDNFDVEIVFDNTPISNEIIDYLKINGIKFSSTPSTKELIEKINMSDLVIGNDSGPVQIAAFLGKKTFSIYGPTNPEFHKPRGEQNYYIQKQLLCSPKKNERLCFTDGGKLGCPSFECLNLLSVDEVYSYLKSEVL